MLFWRGAVRAFSGGGIGTPSTSLLVPRLIRRLSSALFRKEERALTPAAAAGRDNSFTDGGIPLGQGRPVSVAQQQDEKGRVCETTAAAKCPTPNPLNHSGMQIKPQKPRRLFGS